MAENIKQLSNAFSLGAGLNINSNQPIDSRFKVQTLVELTYDWKNKNNGGDILKHEGLLTFVESEGKTFRYRTGASYTSGETTIANWELVPVTADDINSLVEIPEVAIKTISVNGENVTPENGNVNIIIPEVVYPEYTLEAGDTNSVKLLKDGESAGEVSISLTADVVTTTEENTEKVTALSLATEQNIGKIILVKTAEGDYLAGTYIIDGVGSVKYLATTTGTKDDGDVDAKINSAIDSLDSSISVESGFLTGITIENGKLVGYTSDTITIPEVHVPEYTIYKTTNNTSTEYQLQKDGVDVAETIIVPKSEITFKEGDIYIADKHVLITSDLDDYLVKDIKDGDLLLSLNSDGEVSSTISLKYETKTEGEGEEAVTYPVINLYGKDTENPISTINASDFVKDGFLSSASYDEKNHKLTLTWNTDSDIKTPTVIDLSGLIDVHDVVSGDVEGDLVKIVVDEKNENGVLTFTVSIDETNLQNKLDELDGKFIKSVVDNDTATYVKVDTNTVDQVVTISVDESALSNKLDELNGSFIKSVVDNDTATYVKVNAETKDQIVTISVDEETLSSKFEDIEDRLDNIENNEVKKDENSSENFVKLEVNTDENKDVTITIDDSDLKNKIDSIESNFSNYVESINVKEGQSTLLKVEVDNTDKQNPVISLTDNGLDKRITDLEGRVDYDTKCTLATINVADAPVVSENEVEVIAKQTIVLKGEGESLETEQPISSVKVVTKQYVDGKFSEVPTYTAITNDEIDALFV